MKKVAFLNGQIGFHDSVHKEYFNKLNGQGIHVDLIDNLFNKPAKTDMLKRYDTLVMGSTGFDGAKIELIAKRLKATGYVPQTVIFAPDENPFIYLTEQYPKTKFMKLDYVSLEPVDLGYLNTDNELK